MDERDGRRPDSGPGAFGEALASLGAAILTALAGLEHAFQRLHPPRSARLRDGLAPTRDRLDEALRRFRATPAPAGLEPLHEWIERAAADTGAALHDFVDPAPPAEAVARVLGAMSRVCRAQEELYPLRAVLPPVGRWFVEPAFHARLASLDPDPAPGPSPGLHRAAGDGQGGERGGFSLYVPEWIDAQTPRALVVALHGGHGRGRDFLWTWLREARGRGFLLLAPTSAGDTWALHAPAAEAARLRAMVEWVAARWPVDRARVLLTGLSDGATFTLLAGLGEDSVFSALAPVSGVLHPMNFANGNLERANGRRVYLVHGALDWMFPVAFARQAAHVLEEAGAALVYRELPDLSHCYPRGENDRILAWFDPSLALPSAPAGTAGEAGSRRSR